MAVIFREFQAGTNSETVIPVIVLNWNGIDDTYKAVGSALMQTIPTRVLVIDNCSTKDEAARLADWCHHMEHVRFKQNGSNLGFGKAHNEAFRELYEQGHRYVACLNNDAIADPNWLQSLYATLTETGAAMVSSLMLMQSDDRRLDSAGHFILSTGEIMPLGHGSDQTKYTKRIENIGACAGACLYDLEILNKLGYFDERFFVGYEDAELGLRAWLCGYQCIFDPNALVLHKMSASIGRVRSANYLSEIQSHIFYTWFKLMPLPVVLIRIPSMVFKYTLVIFIDVAFLRFKFLKVMLIGIWKFIGQIPETLNARREFFAHQKINRTTTQILESQTSFLKYDARRFWHFVILGKKSALEE